MQRRVGLKTLLLVLLTLLFNILLLVRMCYSPTSQQNSITIRMQESMLHYGSHSNGIRELSEDLTAIASDECMIHTANLSSFQIMRTLRDLHNTLHEIIPRPDGFLPQFKNPCWHMNVQFSSSTVKLLSKSNISDPSVQSQLLGTLFASNDKTLVCLPKVYFIGFPRSGSTQLYKMLLKHPRLLGGNNKEPHWWTKTNFHKKFPHNIIALFQYLSHYYTSSQDLLKYPDSLLIDGSQSTIWDTRMTNNPCAVPHILTNIVPEAKFIVLMRHPVQRLVSDMKYLCEEVWSVHKNGTVPTDYLTNNIDVFLQNAQMEIDVFQKCLEKESLSTCTHRSLSGFNGIMTERCGRVRLGISLYHVHIRQWLKVVPRDRFLFLRTEDLSQDPLKVLSRVWNFLEIPYQSFAELSDILHSHLHSTWNQSLSTDQDKRFEFINQFFKTHNQELVKLLGDGNFSWPV